VPGVACTLAARQRHLRTRAVAGQAIYDNKKKINKKNQKEKPKFPTKNKRLGSQIT
jgi:hypothetical protein